MIEFNYQNGEVVSSPAVIVSGKTSSSVKSGLIQFVNNNNKVFPPQFYEVNNSHFKALVHVSPDEPNNFQVSVLDRAYLNPGGFPEKADRVVDQGTLTLHFNPLPQNKPVHFCVILGSDSTGAYDMPKYKLKRGEVANLDTAIQRLKVACRMMQAFTQDEFHRLGLSNRSFQWVEETTNFQQVFGYNVNSPSPHTEVKIHVIRSPKTVKELRDPDLAQQNPKAKNNGGLFSHAIDLINKHDFMKPYKEKHTAIQCAVMYLDSTWNGDFITTHAALGGGTGEVKLGIFGSHGLHSYPLTFPQISPGFVDATHLSIHEVANDCNQCGTNWECLNICLGAFMHEIGHLFGSPHQTDGVMLRDYMWWNRQFMTRETESLRENHKGNVIGNDGTWLRECHWNIRDLVRYFYHDSFSIPTDANDKSFPKSISTSLNKRPDPGIPSLYLVGQGILSIKSEAGIFMVELCGEDLARHHTAYFPISYGGSGPQHEMLLSYDELWNNFKSSWGGAKENFDVRVLSVAGDLWMPNFKSRCFPSPDSIIRHDFGLGRGPIDGYKSDILGSAKGDMRFIGFDVDLVYRVRVYHGGALDGATFYYEGSQSGQSNGGQPPPVPKRDYLSRVMNKLNIDGGTARAARAATLGGEATIGNKKPHYTDFDLERGERITKLSFRNGQWVDGMQIETNRGRKSEMLGNPHGGHLSALEPPSSQHQIVGMYAYTGRWIDGIGIIYAQL